MDSFFQDWLLSPTTLRLGAVILAFIIIRLISTAITRMLVGRIKERGMRHQARKATNFAGYVIFLLLAGFIFSNQLSGLTVALGVATAGIAFALQEVIASIAGWMAILAGQFYDTGDRVQLGGIIGDVMDIGILRTTIMECGGWVSGDLYNGRTVRVANSFVFKEPVYNYSGGFPFLWDEIKVPVKFGSDHNLARRLMEKVAVQVVGEYSAVAAKTWAKMQTQYLIEDAETGPMVSMVFNDNWIEFTIRYVVAYKKRRGTKDELSRLLLDAFEKTDGKVGLASATFHLVETPTFNVKLARE